MTKEREKVKSKYRVGLLLCALLPALIHSSITRAQSPEQSPTGPYIGLGLGIAADLFDDLPAGVDFDPGLGFTLDVGYRFHPNPVSYTHLTLPTIYPA